MSAQTFADLGIIVSPEAVGEVDTTCPRCSHARKKSRGKCLSVNTHSGAYYCHHCGWSGSRGRGGTGYAIARQHILTPSPPQRYTVPASPPAGPVPRPIVHWFAARGIPQSIVWSAGISAGQEFCPQLGRVVLAIRFPYRRDGALINIKYRSLAKQFWMVKGAQRILYGLDDLRSGESVCVVEGELDKLSIDAVGGLPTLSVPDGAPPPNARHSASKFNFLDSMTLARLRGAPTVLIATDMDAPGMRLAEDLAERIGYVRCRRVVWPDGCKDANEVLVRLGPAAVLAALAKAQPYSGSTPDPGNNRAPAIPARLRMGSPRLRLREARHAGA